MFEEAFAAANLPGAVGMIVDRDGVRYARALGVTDVDSGAPLAEDTPFQIASMTKALVTVAVMQLVEQGKLDLDAPIGDVLSDLADPQVLTGFDEAGKPRLRPAARPITMRHLLTHTSGLGYFFVHPEILQYFSAVGMPAPGSKDAIRMPLMFDPGDSWEYSVGIDWAGLAVEALTGQALGDYMQDHIFGPLGMTHTRFADSLPEGAAQVHVRTEDGSLAVQPMFIGGGEYHNGGGGLIGTAPDYARFVRAILRGGELDGQRVLKEETVREMARNQIGELRAGRMGSALPHLAPVFDQFPDQHTGWGLGFLTLPQGQSGGRSPNSLSWAGIFNSYYWIDPDKGVGGVMMSQLSPFGDAGALSTFGALERQAYAGQ
ncbi:CubicO group peptidase (beta-lactamase class C family) [Novosphingobium kunmingense]|uniref:CubicO group peptidase (Beta-lactamase class C family) n=1 Tax=Novosphingobium kunmingense TaxID=1211806 RepID=A0A2N0HK20_9SPHN|nr:serine hydrolase domain-containing protein [Novosphingobium kunmingense]PKB19235.1 CubicO group peptidase (beta-lactamase class C family) [Novosphingobium kunmingense]